MPEPLPTSFAEVLDALCAEPAPAPSAPMPVAEAIVAFRERARRIDNLGLTGDERDLYPAVEALSAAVRAHHPGSLCRSGCSGCCDSAIAVFDVTRAEWQAIERHLEREWSPEARAALRSRVLAEHGPRLVHYKLLAAIRHFEPVADRYFARRPYRCPFLAEGRCGIYAARPLACRMYGAFAIRTRWYQPASIYACAAQTAFFRGERSFRPLQLPTVNMLVGRFRRLLGGRRQVLPLWLADWARRSAS